MLFTHFLKTRCKLKWRCFFSASLALSMKTKMKRLTHLWLLAFVGHKTRLAWDVPLSLKTRRSEHRNISLFKKKKQKWIHMNQSTLFLWLFLSHTNTHKTFPQGICISPVYSGSISICSSGRVLLFQSGPCCRAISLWAFKTMDRMSSLLFILRV